MSSTNSTADWLLSLASMASRTWDNQDSNASLVRVSVPLYLKCAATPFSAISSMRFERICTSTQRPSLSCAKGILITVV